MTDLQAQNIYFLYDCDTNDRGNTCIMMKWSEVKREFQLCTLKSITKIQYFLVCSGVVTGAF